MPVYFIRDALGEATKIGRAKNIKKRLQDLQTGNPRELQLLGWINIGDDVQMEFDLHGKYSKKNVKNEWFSVTEIEVLSELKRFLGFVPKKGQAFEIVGFDRDGIPEFAETYEWVVLDYSECCPYCGCLCGMHLDSASNMYYCIKCDTLSHLDEVIDYSQE